MNYSTLFTLILCLCFCTKAAAQTWQTDGNLKYRLVNTAYPQSSVFSGLSGSNITDQSLTARLNFNKKLGLWSAQASYQIAAIHGETVELTRGQAIALASDSSFSLFARAPIQDDSARLFDLTEIIQEGQDYAVAHRLDRLVLGYQGEQNVIKIGRQAVSWGNGLIYTPMDFLNPFDPTAIDTEYKAGDDMLYAQHLFDNGDDVQLVWVARRDENGATGGDFNSAALKYHGFIGSSEFDLLIAEHYNDTMIGVGGTISVGGAVLRGDWVTTETDNKRFNNFVANISYSWRAWNKNITGSLEYFHNDFGVQSAQLNFTDLANTPELLDRVQRGELFTLGRDYIAGSAVVEMAPLWLLTPNIFYNVSDNSALTQLVSQHDLSQNTQLAIALSIPLGAKGTEFGGFAVANENSDKEVKFSNSSWSLYAQLAWYF